ncbi:NUDIX domain-containing protein [Streptomyces sp. P38-E01]|uniref:NUDIX domain-containing protein n=1 Tax=Streptomyces tardus TaxID=2780544 RepID=A0A949JHP8_9ACTN|nr:NUDIX domain-containing protein [Streptomyces tardus]MBU7598830.1 NUDIX domain-containing protein [Streptomyces tardus]
MTSDLPPAHDPHPRPATDPHGLPVEPPETPVAVPPLATGPRRMELLAFQPVEDVRPSGRQEDAVIAAYVLVALWHRDRLLLVRVRDRDCWELPGGGVEADESAREAAVRELREETGEEVAPETLRLVGYATTALGPARGTLIGAVFTARVAEPGAFTPNEEICEVCWWDGQQELPRLQTVDTYLAELTRER